jgi:hypothetical protein
MSAPENRIMIEVTAIDYMVFHRLSIVVVKNEGSINGWRDLTIQGTKENLIKYLYTFHGEGEAYFNENQV